MNNATITMYRPTGPEEWALVQATGCKRWPPRLPEQPIFYPVANREYAEEIAKQWNVPASGVGYVTRFDVNAEFAAKYEIHQVGGAHHLEWWIPAEELEELNDHIVGEIELIGEYR